MAKRAQVGFLAVTIFAVLSLLLWVQSNEKTVRDFDTEFRRYVKAHGKSYSDTEYSQRFRLYRESAAYVETSNAQFHPFQLALNSFADLSDSEFSHLLGYRSSSTPDFPAFPLNTTSLPVGVDWREAGAVGPVRDQGNCGACYAFAAAGAVEGAEYLETGVLNTLSIQELVDCSVLTGNRGCKGGKITSAFRYIERFGLTIESIYPYVHYEHQDCLSLPTSPKVHISSHLSIPQFDQLQLKAAVALQPVAAAIQADQPFFRLYSQGVLDRSCGSHLNHAVLIVGYGTTPEGTDYWLVRNSWGPRWGEAGYVKILREDSARDAGACGVTLDASYVS